MAATLPPAQLESLSKPVQELAMDRDSLPERYIYKGTDGAIDISSPVMEIPVIDLNCLSSSSPSAEKELEKLRLSLSFCGCFQV